MGGFFLSQVGKRDWDEGLFALKMMVNEAVP